MDTDAVQREDRKPIRRFVAGRWWVPSLPLSCRWRRHREASTTGASSSVGTPWIGPRALLGQRRASEGSWKARPCQKDQPLGLVCESRPPSGRCASDGPWHLLATVSTGLSFGGGRCQSDAFLRCRARSQGLRNDPQNQPRRAPNSVFPPQPQTVCRHATAAERQASWAG